MTEYFLKDKTIKLSYFHCPNCGSLYSVCQGDDSLTDVICPTCGVELNHKEGNEEVDLEYGYIENEEEEEDG